MARGGKPDTLKHEFGDLRQSTTRALLFMGAVLAVLALARTPAPAHTSACLTNEFQVAETDFLMVGDLVSEDHMDRARAEWSRVSSWRPGCGVRIYGPGESLLVNGDFVKAFSDYYETFFNASAGGFHVTLNPLSEESGAKADLRAALQLGTRGNFTKALQVLTRAVKVDPYFGEGDYFLGTLYWATGDKKLAIEKWKAAVLNPGYTQPPDGWYPPAASVAALEMLFLLQSRGN